MTGSVGTLPPSAEWIERRREQYRSLELEPESELPPATADVIDSSATEAPLQLRSPSVEDTSGGSELSGTQSETASAIQNAPTAAVALDEIPHGARGAAEMAQAASAPVAAPHQADERDPASPEAPTPGQTERELSRPLPEERVHRLQVLAEEVAACTACSLHETRTNTVFARGNGSSGICFVGEGPGHDEDLQGAPFVGKAGQLLDRMITAMGLDRDDVYVCNIVKCRPPKNRKPQPDEMRACRGFLVDQLEAIEPRVIVALGATAVEGLIGLSMGITRMRGQWRLYQGKIPVMPTFHPAYLLRQPGAKREVWDDLKQVLDHVGRQVPRRRK